ncbi:MAG TPA: DUF805 domain-containing protein [Bradyrhizobium sp.]|jgi:uncharacterized membrane protein YhaH (DUF805 family)|nr:DUF805 domain-containing protein [Bradyrhizobium sp.]
MDYKWFLFRFEGHINRAKYWLAALIILCWMMFVLMLLAAFGKVFGIADRGYAFDIFGIAASFQFADHDLASKASPFPQIITIPMTVVFAWAYAATSIKRLHDRNKSGWWIVPFVAAPGLFGRFEDWLGDSSAAAVLGLAVFVLYIWGFIEMAFLKGTHGPNRFGSDPLAPVSTGAHAASRWDQQSELEFVPHSAGPSPGPHVKRGHD